MKKLIYYLILCIVLSFSTSSWADLAATTVWEIQQDATANNVNGCGYNASNAAPGTDRSQTTAAYKDHNDLASADGDANPTIVTSAAHPFTAADNGNIIHITAGGDWTGGWYEIVSVDGSNNATLDRAASGTNGAITGGTYYLGGACSMNSALDHDFLNQIIAGNTVYVKYNATPIATGENVTDTTDGTSTTSINIVGYDTTRTTTNTDTNRPTINPAAYTFTVGGYVNLKNFIFTVTGANGISLGTNCSVYNIKVTNSSATADRYGLIAYGSNKVINSEFISTNGFAIFLAGMTNLYGNYIHDSKTGIKVGAANSNIIMNVLDTFTTAAIDGASYGNNNISNNTMYGGSSPTGTGVLFTTGNAQLLYNNIIANFATGASSTNLYTDTVSNYNNFYNNTTADRTNWPTGVNDIDADPGFQDAANGDFRVGTGVKALGFPGQFPGVAALDGYLDIGAVQRVEPVAGGGGGACGW